MAQANLHNTSHNIAQAASSKKYDLIWAGRARRSNGMEVGMRVGQGVKRWLSRGLKTSTRLVRRDIQFSVLTSTHKD